MADYVLVSPHAVSNVNGAGDDVVAGVPLVATMTNAELAAFCIVPGQAAMAELTTAAEKTKIGRSISRMSD